MTLCRLAHFVREALELSAILRSYKSDQGHPPYHPGMLMAVTGLNRPDFRIISDFRKRPRA